MLLDYVLLFLISCNAESVTAYIFTFLLIIDFLLLGYPQCLGIGPTQVLVKLLSQNKIDCKGNQKL